MPSNLRSFHTPLITRLHERLSNLSVATLVGVICAIHIALLLWQNYLVQTNDDGILYLRAARLFAEGRFEEARALYKWIAYPFMVGSISAVTGFDAMPIAYVLNGIASTVTVLILLRCVWTSSPYRTTLICAALLLLGNMWFNDLRATIVREHFYFMFGVIGFYFMLRDVQAPRTVYRIGFVAATLLAALFRIEALGFLVLIPLLRLTIEAPPSRRIRLLAIGGLLVAGICGALILAFWSDSGSLSSLLAKPRARIEILRDQVLWPFEFRKAHLAYASMILGLLLYGLINSIGLAPLVTTIFGASHDPALRRSPALYLSALYLIVGVVILGMQTYFNLFFDPRHGLILSLILTVPAAMGFRDLLSISKNAPRWSSLRFINGFVIVLLVIGFAVGIKKYDSQRYRLEAGKWLAENISKDAKVEGNSNQILFYGGFVNNDPELVRLSASHNLDLSSRRDWKSYDVVVMELRKDQLGQLPLLEKNIGRAPVKSFRNARGDGIFIYKLR